MVELKDLYYTVAIAECGRLGKAAERLNLSQPALSKFLQRQKEELGDAVFKKIGHDLQLTEFGNLYADYARRMIQLKEEMDLALQKYKGKHETQISIAAGFNVAALYLTRALPIFRQRYPNVHISICEGKSAQLTKDVLDGKVDLAICTYSQETPSLVQIPLMCKEVAIAVNEKNEIRSHAETRPGFQHPWIDIHAFKDEVFIMMQEGQWPYYAAKNCFQATKFTPRKTLEVYNYRTVAELVRTGDGVGFMVDDGGLDDTGLVLYSVGPKPQYVTTNAVFRIDNPNSSYLWAFIDIVKRFFPKTE